MNRACFFCLLIATFTLGGCSLRNAIKGRVIQGNVSFVCVVDQTDPRLQTAGVAGVAVESKADEGRDAGTVFATTQSSEDGSFTLTFKEQPSLMKPVRMSGKLAGYNPASESMMLPPADKRLLIILKKQADSKPPPPK